MPVRDQPNQEHPRRPGEKLGDTRRGTIATEGPAVPERVEKAKAEADERRDSSSIH